MINKYSFFIIARLFLEVAVEFVRLTRHLGAIAMAKDKVKLEAKLSILNHAIEKGLSLPNPKVGFGESKVLEILLLLEKYEKMNCNTAFVEDIYENLGAYFHFNKTYGCENRDLVSRYNTLSHREISDMNKAVIFVEKKENTPFRWQEFMQFIDSRHSVRDFSNEPVDLNLVLKAIEMSKKTPSSCNRQPWKIYVFTDRKKKKALLEWQMGSRGFCDSIDVAVLITCSLKRYFIGENHQAYVDGGLYAMTLMYALHSLGLGSIPLTLGLPSNKLRYLYHDLNVKKDEMPIMIIGVGMLKERYSVAKSMRKNVMEYTTII